AAAGSARGASCLSRLFGSTAAVGRRRRAAEGSSARGLDDPTALSGWGGDSGRSHSGSVDRGASTERLYQCEEQPRLPAIADVVLHGRAGSLGGDCQGVERAWVEGRE